VVSVQVFHFIPQRIMQMPVCVDGQFPKINPLCLVLSSVFFFCALQFYFYFLSLSLFYLFSFIYLNLRLLVLTPCLMGFSITVPWSQMK
jgi:hypothetical protein